MKNKNLIALVVLFTSLALATHTWAFVPQKGGKGKSGRNGGHNHGNRNRGGNQGRSFLNISPGGISYGYQNRNFGFAIGGIGGGGLNVGPANFGRSSAQYGSFYQPPQNFYPQQQPLGFSAPVQNYSPNIVYSTPTNLQPAGTANPVATPSLANGRNSALTIPANGSATQYTKQAEQAFKLRNYEESRRLVEHSLLEDKNNGHLLLFASHISLALQDYGRAASELDAATARLHPNDWDYLVRNIPFWYPNNAYGNQMTALNRAIETNPNADVLTLRGFQRACDGQVSDAKSDLEKAAVLAPHNQLVQRLLSGLNGTTNQVPAQKQNPTPTKSTLIGEPTEVLPPPIEDSAAKSVIIRND